MGPRCRCIWLVSILLSLLGIMFVRSTVIEMERTNDFASQTAKAADSAAEASLLSARAALVEIEPLIAIDSAKVGPAYVNDRGANLNIEVKWRNAGGSAAYGITVSVKGFIPSDEGFGSFVEECRNVGEGKNTFF